VTVYFTDLDVATIDRECAAVVVAEFLVWWFQEGRYYYGRRRSSDDGGIRLFASDAVTAVGGWAATRRLIRGHV